MNGNGLTAGDILALSRDNGAFDWSWIIGLIVVGGIFGNGGFGFGGNSALTEEYIANQFTQRDIFGVQTAMLESNNALTRDVLENRYTCSQNACNTQKEILQNRYDNALQTQTLSAQMQNCCCTLESKIIEENQKTRDMIQQDKIDQLREQVNTSNLALFGQNIVNQILPRSVPAYPSCSPYVPANYGYNGCNGSVI